MARDPYHRRLRFPQFQVCLDGLPKLEAGRDEIILNLLPPCMLIFAQTSPGCGGERVRTNPLVGGQHGRSFDSAAFHQAKALREVPRILFLPWHCPSAPVVSFFHICLLPKCLSSVLLVHETTGAE